MDVDPVAAASHGTNFHPGFPKHAQGRDLTVITPCRLARELDVGDVAGAFEVVVGDPPCQAFARVGRSKLRAVDADPDAFRADPRARLNAPYLRYVESCLPLTVLIENVPDVMNFRGRNVAEQICAALESLGYVCAYTLLNAAF